MYSVLLLCFGCRHPGNKAAYGLSDTEVTAQRDHRKTLSAALSLGGLVPDSADEMQPVWMKSRL